MSCKLSDKCDNVFACNILRPNVELLGCNFYKPKKPMTNEEWLRSLNTEQLAEWIHTAIFDDSFANKIADEAYMNMQTRDDYIEMWLKQPHTTKE